MNCRFEFCVAGFSYLIWWISLLFWHHLDVVDWFVRLLDLMDFLLLLRGVLFSLYIRLLFHISQNELGWLSLVSFKFYFFLVVPSNYQCDWAVCLSNFMMTWLFVNSTVLELLRKALSLLTQSLLRVLVKMPTVAIVLRFLTPVFHPRRDNLLLLCQGWRGKWVHFGCIWFRDGLRYIN